MNTRLLDRILPKGTELLRRLALAEVLGPPPSSVTRREQMHGGGHHGPTGAPSPPGAPKPPGPGREG